MSTAVKLSSDVVESARREAKIANRSMTQQVERWMRIGRLVERMGALDAPRLRAALAAELPFDELTGPERSVVLADLEHALLDSSGNQQLAADLAQSEVPVSTLVDGAVVWLHPDGTVEPVAK